MGLSKSSVGLGALDVGLEIHKKRGDDIVAALAGNPNVGKSTVFNAMTGLRQHTGNWVGKTVAGVRGMRFMKGRDMSWWISRAVILWMLIRQKRRWLAIFYVPGNMMWR